LIEGEREGHEFWDRTESLHKAGLPEERAPVKAEHYANGGFPSNCCVHGRDLNVRLTSFAGVALATTVGAVSAHSHRSTL